jgi:hypothetical protein
MNNLVHGIQHQKIRLMIFFSIFLHFFDFHER